MIDRSRFIESMAAFMAELSPSVTRGQPEGVRRCATAYLRTNSTRLLAELANPKTFGTVLNAKTDELKLCLPGQSWGWQGNALIFFFAMQRLMHLTEIEPLLEVPLDSRVATSLRNEQPNLGAWSSIRGLTSEVSANYQEAALKIATKHGILRVHLDLWFYPAPSE